MATMERDRPAEAATTNGPVAETSAGRWPESARVLAVWTAVAVVTAIGQSQDPFTGRLRPTIPAASVAFAFVTSYLWAALTLPIFRLSRRFAFDRAQWPRQAAVLLGVGVLVAIVMEPLVSFLRFQVFFQWRGGELPFDPFWGIRHFMWLDDLVVYLAILTAGVARHSVRRLEEREREAALHQAEAALHRAEAAQHRAEAAQLEAQLADARLDALRRQLDPHFLFNTLNAVSSLVGSNPRGVRRMVARLSGLLRHSLEGSSEPEVPVAEELDVLRQYVEIMEIRFEGRLQFETRADPGALDALVPNLILQPLVENAIEHGVGRLPATVTGTVEVGVRRDEDVVVLTVRDNGPVLGDDAALSRDGGVGLRNTRERLAQLYGDDGVFTLEPALGGGVIATVTLPYHTRADLHAAAAAPDVARDAARDAAPDIEPVAART